MGTVGKIFVVLNLFFALAFVAIAAALLAEKDDWKTRYENERDIRRATESVAEADRNVLQAKLDDERRKVDQLRESHLALMKDYENQREENKNLTETQTRLEEKLNRLEESYSSIDDRINDLQRNNERLNRLNLQLEQEKVDARERQRQAEEAYHDMLAALEESEKRLRDAGQQTQAMRRQIEDYKLRYEDMIRQGFPASEIVPPRAIDGLVRAVSDEVPLVMLSVGKDDGVEPGYTFTVYRGSEYVGKVQVSTVFADSASASILQEYSKLQPREGDHVTTRIR